VDKVDLLLSMPKAKIHLLWSLCRFVSEVGVVLGTAAYMAPKQAKGICLR
jgi:hypothetical protein